MPNDAAAEKAGSAEHSDDATARYHHDFKFASLCRSFSLLGVEEPIRAIEQSFAMMKSFTGSVAVGRPPLTIVSLLVRPEARLPHLPD